jgi:hypothetical protein
MADAGVTFVVPDAVEFVAGPIGFVTVDRLVVARLVDAAAEPVLTLLQRPVPAVGSDAGGRRYGPS